MTFGSPGVGKMTSHLTGRWCQRLTKVCGKMSYEHSVETVILAEAMLWLEGKRALDIGNEIRGLRNPGKENL
jgi:hypothetical protein